MDVTSPRDDWPHTSWIVRARFSCPTTPRITGSATRGRLHRAGVQNPATRGSCGTRAAVAIRARLGDVRVRVAEECDGMGQVGALSPDRCGAARDSAGVAVPFQSVAHRRERAREKAQLREELKQLERRPLLRPIDEKTLWELWCVYGFEIAGFRRRCAWNWRRCGSIGCTGRKRRAR